MTAAAGFEDFAGIETVPRDGRFVWVGDPDVGAFVMRWNSAGYNPLVQDDPTGIWETPDAGMTWTELRGMGPTLWKPCEVDRRSLN